MKPVKFYILERDYSGVFKKERADSFRVNQETAVIAYKKWFFNCLSQLGKIVLISEKLEKEGQRLKRLLGRPDAIFVSVNFLLGDNLISTVAHRLLWLSMGSLLLPYHFDKLKYLPSAQVDLVSTRFQKERIKLCLGDFAPRMEIFCNKIDSDFFTIPDQEQRRSARKKLGIKEGQLHFIYAGRWIVTKGICQLIRALDIWPLFRNMVFTLAGNVDSESRLIFSFAQHKTFSRFFSEEVLRHKERPWLRLEQAKNKQELRDLFWSADLFVNLSIQPDEDFGVTPRQALSCGVPVVTTNFCGLRALADNMPWKGLDTYPTLFGCRFSLRQFRSLLQNAIARRTLLSAQQYRDFILKDCNPGIAKDNLKKAIEYLLKRPPEKNPNLEKTGKDIKRKLFNASDGRIFKYYLDSRKELPLGAYVHGDGPSHYGFALSQGIYSAISAAPKVEKNSTWRGFFRIGLWDKENALVEFGYPGPRIRRYPKRAWGCLVKCTRCVEPDEYIIKPKEKDQLKLVQELVDLGYLVPEAW